jgi:hypothetical protein
MMVDSTERLKTMPWKTCELARPLPTILHTRTLSTLKVVFSGIMDMQAWTKKKKSKNKMARKNDSVSDPYSLITDSDPSF